MAPDGLSAMGQIDFFERLVGNGRTLRALLESVGRSDLADTLPEQPEQVPDMFNPYFLEKMRANEKTGQIMLLHSDNGWAKVGLNGLFESVAPDERGLMPMMALLKHHPEFRNNRLVWAHLGVGNWTYLTVDHINRLDRMLDLFPGLRYDYSWTPLGQYLNDDPAVAERFIEFAVKHQDRLLYGSDGISMMPSAQMWRHFTELEPVFVTIVQRYPDGADIVRKITGGNYVRLMDDAERDTSQRFVDEYFSDYHDAWAEVISEFPESFQRAFHERAQRLRQSFEPDPTRALGPGVGPREWGGDWRRNPQIESAIKAYQIVYGGFTLAKAAKVKRSDSVRQRQEKAATGRRNRQERGGLRPVETAEELGMEKTVQALASAHYALKAAEGMTPEQRQELIERVLRDVENTERDRYESAAAMNRLHQLWRRRATMGWTAMASTAAAGVTAYTMGLTPALTAGAVTLANGIGFVVRSVLTNIKNAHTTDIRITTDALMERERIDFKAINRLAKMYIKLIVRDIKPGGKKFLSEYPGVVRHAAEVMEKIKERTRQFFIDYLATVHFRLPDGVTAKDRRVWATMLFSRWKDYLNRLTGGTVDSVNRLNPQSGTLGRAVNSIIAATWAAHFFGHLYQALTTHGLAQWVSAAYLPVDIAFAAATLPAIWSGYDKATSPGLRKLQNLAFTPLTLANAGLTAQFLFAGQWTQAVTAASLTAGTGVLAKMGIKIELKTGRDSAKKGPTATYVAMSAMQSLGMMMLDQSPAMMAAATALALSGPTTYLARGAWNRYRAIRPAPRHSFYEGQAPPRAQHLGPPTTPEAGPQPDRTEIAPPQTGNERGASNGSPAAVEGYELTGADKAEFEEFASAEAAGRPRLETVINGERGPPSVLVPRAAFGRTAAGRLLWEGVLAAGPRMLGRIGRLPATARATWSQLAPARRAVRGSAVRAVVGVMGRLVRPVLWKRLFVWPVGPAVVVGGELRAAQAALVEALDRYQAFVLYGTHYWVQQVRHERGLDEAGAVAVVARSMRLPEVWVATRGPFPSHLPISPPPELAMKLVGEDPETQVRMLQDRHHEILRALYHAAARKWKALGDWDDVVPVVDASIGRAGRNIVWTVPWLAPVVEKLSSAARASLLGLAQFPVREPTSTTAGETVRRPYWVVRWLAGQTRPIRGPPAKLAAKAQELAAARGRAREDEAYSVGRLAEAVAALDARPAWIRDVPAQVLTGELAGALGLPGQVVLAVQAADYLPATTPEALDEAQLLDEDGALDEVRRRMAALVSAAEQERHRLTYARARAQRENASYVEAITPHVVEAFKAGVSLERIVFLAGLTRLEVDEITRGYAPNPAYRTAFVDRVLLPVLRRVAIGVMAVTGRGDEFAELVRGLDLRAEFAALDPGRDDFPQQVNELLTVLGIDLPIDDIRSVGGARLSFERVWDVHFHLWGYDVKINDTVARLAKFLDALAASGHLGLIVVSPIPQRGVGSGPAGQAFYYLTNLVKLVTLFDYQTLRMNGTLTDILLANAIAQLPPHLRWRVIPGISGQRVDDAVGGHPDDAGFYVKLMRILNPIATFLAETTLMKEAVHISLGRQMSRIVTSEYKLWSRQLIAGANLVKQELATGSHRDQLRATLENNPLKALFSDEGGVSRYDVLQILKQDVAGLKTLLEVAGHHRQARVLRTSAPEMYNQRLVGLLKALARTGLVIVLHSDGGDAPMDADGVYTEGPVDDRFTMEFLALLASDPVFKQARIVWAHLGVGTFTELTLAHMDLLQFALDGFPNLHFDVSWNETIRHIKKNPALRERFLDFAVANRDRLLRGSDVVSPESLPHYLRHDHDIESLIRALLARPDGEEIVRLINYGNAARLRREAQKVSEQWVFDEIAWMLEAKAAMAAGEPGAAGKYAATWGPVLDQLPARYSRDVLARHTDLHNAGMRATVDGPSPLLGPGANWRDNRQLTQAIRFLKAMDVATTRGERPAARLRVRALVTALQNMWVDAGAFVRDVWRYRPTQRALPPATDADALGHGQVTTATLIADEQTRLLHDGLIIDDELTHSLHDGFGIDAEAERAGRLGTIRAAVENNERTQLAARAGIKNLVTLLKTRNLIGYGIFFVVQGIAIGLGTVAGLRVGGYELAIAGMAAYIVRTGISTFRHLVSQYLRSQQDAIIERAQLADTDDVKILAWAAHRYARKEVRSPGKRAEADSLLLQLVALMQLVVHVPLGTAADPVQGRTENHTDRDRTLTALYSLGWDRIKAVTGMVIAGALRTSRVGDLLLPLTWQANGLYHLYGLLTAQDPITLGINTLYLVADIVFFAVTLPVAINGISGYDSSSRPLYRRLQHLAGFPALVIANFLLLANQAISPTHSLLLTIAAYGLATSSYNITKLGFDAEIFLGRQPAKKGANAAFIMYTSLMGYALAVLGQLLGGTLWALVPGAITAVAGFAYPLAEQTWERMKSPTRNQSKQRWLNRLLSSAVIGGLAAVATGHPVGLAIMATVGTLRAVLTTLRAHHQRTAQRADRNVARPWRDPPGNGSLAAVEGYELRGPDKAQFEELVAPRIEGAPRLETIINGERGPPLVLVGQASFGRFGDLVVAYTFNGEVVMSVENYTRFDEDFLGRVLEFEQEFRIRGHSSRDRVAEAKVLIDELNAARAHRLANQKLVDDGGLNDDEKATLDRLRKIFPDSGLRGVNKPEGDFEDRNGTLFDAMGSPKAAQYWSAQRQNFLDQIPRHAQKSDFAVVDLTGFDPAQTQEVLDYEAALSQGLRINIIIIQDTNILN
ncbi:hypothetical protein Atai01_56810 [Amycolatopsis taiwanensis]|uniref:Amidohydrolase-related domain-containing protein n=1 Tax=Amycolatopsis taiwanensis TaxID=342230 RepID=A0A9W6R7K2_9PSEU|nr:hypothetical protein Atai01_56810 [Amycolatopsis taiwanensis]